VPDIIKFIPDALLLFLCFLVLPSRRFVVTKNIKPLLYIILGFFVYTLIAYLFNFQSPFYYLWGLRNHFRFYAAFVVYIFFVDRDEADGWLKLLDVLFWVNFVVTVIQFAFFGLEQDFLGGLFGAQRGSNGHTIIFMMIVVTKSLYSTFGGKEKVLSCVLKCTGSLLIAAMAELKFYFFLFIFILIAASFSTKFSKRKLIMVIVASVVIVIGANILINLFEFDGFLSFEQLWEMATKENYSSENDLNRLSAIFTLSNTIVTDPLHQLFGLGLGNCDTSSLDVLNTPFFDTYSYLHYMWFTAVKLFLETGFIGLALFLSFFVACFFLARKEMKAENANKLYCQMAMVLSIMSCVLSFYNSSLSTEAGYMMFFVLALPFLKDKPTKRIVI